MVASAAASVRPLRRVEGWWSGHVLNSPFDAATRTRLRLWDALQGEVVRVRWIDGLKLDLRFATDIARLVFVAGEIDPNELSFLADVLKPGMCVIDVGANEGLYTLFCRRRVDANGHIISIEPSLREAIHLRRNLRLNKFDDIEVETAAVGDRIGCASLHVAEIGHAGHNALGPPAAPWVRVDSQNAVPITTLDALAEARQWPRIDLIKMDIEGSEFAALRGAESLLLRDQPILLLEAEAESLSLRGDSLGSMLSWLAARGFKGYDFSGPGGFLAPVLGSKPKTVNLVFASAAETFRFDHLN